MKITTEQTIETSWWFQLKDESERARGGSASFPTHPLLLSFNIIIITAMMMIIIIIIITIIIIFIFIYRSLELFLSLIPLSKYSICTQDEISIFL